MYDTKDVFLQALKTVLKGLLLALFFIACLFLFSAAMAMPLGLQGRVQLGQEFNRGESELVSASSETDIYAHLYRSWSLTPKTEVYGRTSVTSVFRQTGEEKGFDRATYRAEVGVNF